MAKYWVGGTGNTSDDTNHWALTSGGSPGAGNLPIASDDIFFDASSGTGTVTIDTDVACRSLQTAGSSLLTCVHNAGIFVRAGDTTPGAGNIALDLSGFTSYTVLSTLSTYTFNSSSTTQQTVKTNGFTLGNFGFGITANSGIGGSWLLTDSVTCNQFNFSQGTVDTGNKSINCFNMLSTTLTNIRTITLGSSAITLTGAAGFNALLIGPLIVTANTATMTFTNGSAFFRSGAMNWNGLRLVFNVAGIPTLDCTNGAWTVGNITRTGTAVFIDAFTILGTAGITCSGVLTLAGAAANQRLLVQNSVLGTSCTLTAATTSLSNVDFMDVTGAGAASPFVASSGTLGDCQGNTGITFTTPATQTWQTTGSGNWSDVTKWTSRVPLPQDNVVFSSAFVSSTQISTDMTRLGKNITWSAATWTGTAVQMRGFSSTTSSWYGDLTLKTGMSTGSVSGNSWQMRGRGAQNLTPNNVSIGIGLSVVAPGGSYDLAGDYTQSNPFQVSNGTYNTNSHNVSMTSSWTVSSSAVCNFGTSTITFTTASAITFMSVAGASNVSAASATFVLSVAAATLRTFAGGNGSYGTLTYTVAGSTGTLSITGNNTFGTINFSDATNARTLQFTSFTTNTITNRNIVGTSGKLMTVSAVTSGSPATLISSNPWFMGANSVNVSGNSGLTFSAGSTMNFLSVQDIIGASPASNNPSNFLVFFS